MTRSNSLFFLKSSTWQQWYVTTADIIRTWILRATANVNTRRVSGSDTFRRKCGQIECVTKFVTRGNIYRHLSDVACVACRRQVQSWRLDRLAKKKSQISSRSSKKWLDQEENRTYTHTHTELSRQLFLVSPDYSRVVHKIKPHPLPSPSPPLNELVGLFTVLEPAACGAAQKPTLESTAIDKPTSKRRRGYSSLLATCEPRRFPSGKTRKRHLIHTSARIPHGAAAHVHQPKRGIQASFHQPKHPTMTPVQLRIVSIGGDWAVLYRLKRHFVVSPFVPFKAELRRARRLCVVQPHFSPVYYQPKHITIIGSMSQHNSHIRQF